MYVQQHISYQFQKENQHYVITNGERDVAPLALGNKDFESSLRLLMTLIKIIPTKMCHTSYFFNRNSPRMQIMQLINA